MFEKIPPSGIRPCSLLKERFKLVRYVRLARYIGMFPERLVERSIVLIAFMIPISGVSVPIKRLFDKLSPIRLSR